MVCAHLGQHIGAVNFDRARADFKPFTDQAIGQAIGDPGQHFTLTPGKFADPAARHGFTQPQAAE